MVPLAPLVVVAAAFSVAGRERGAVDEIDGLPEGK